MNHSQEQLSILPMDFHIEETSETIKTNRSDCNLPQMIQIQNWLRQFSDKWGVQGSTAQDAFLGCRHFVSIGIKIIRDRYVYQ